jgi:hypothetical protein
VQDRSVILVFSFSFFFSFVFSGGLGVSRCLGCIGFSVVCDVAFLGALAFRHLRHRLYMGKPIRVENSSMGKMLLHLLQFRSASLQDFVMACESFNKNPLAHS